MMNDNINPAHVEWSRNLFRVLVEGGSWAVPRSGLIFRKHGQEFHLTARMPYDPAMPCTAKQLEEQQDGDLKVVKDNFGAAGVTVVDKTSKEGTS